MKQSHHIQKKDNFFLYDSVNLPMATEILLASSETCSVMLKNTVLKQQERSPLKYVVVFLIPRNIVNNQADAISMFTEVIDKLYESKLLASKESDNAKLQYEEFIMLLLDISRISLIFTCPMIA